MLARDGGSCLRTLCLALVGMCVVGQTTIRANTPESRSSEARGNAAMVLKYDRPANSWMTEALPIGNGRLGAMIFGGAENERVQFNENSLWTGMEVNTDNSSALGSYQAFGDVHLLLPGHEKTTQYVRKLDIGRAVAEVAYRAGSVNYRREYFASHADQVVVVRLTADRPGSYTGEIELTSAHSAPVMADGDRLTFAGHLGNGERYEAQLLAVHEGGSLQTAGGRLAFNGCTSLTICLGAGTDYLPDYHRLWKGADPHDRVSEQVSSAAHRSYQALFADHVRDYRQMFDRVSLRLGNTPLSRSALPTDRRLIAYARGGNDPELNALYFQYGRYLLISSSRPGSLPANLQGLWNDSNDPPWHSDYHSNINFQMNYWPAEVTNLSDCHAPMLDLIHSELEPWRKQTQQAAEFKLADGRPTRGWTVRTETNPWGGTTWNWNKPANAWFCQHFWEHYAFTGDKGYLRSTAYPILKETVEFWEDHLKALSDGTLVAPAGWSPEHGPVEDGVSYDQEIIWDLFTNYIEAADALGIDREYRRKVAGMRDKLLRPKVGKWGQLQEWAVDRDDPKDQHRHVSHLFGLYPGRQISPDTTPELAAAAKKSLEARGDGGTGWSRAWKISYWARLRDGDHAYLLLKNLLLPVGGVGTDYSNGGGTYTNLFDAHPPFQIDGNFGATAGVAEMLLQSHTGVIDLLPALPSAWPSGTVKGLRARGGVEVDMAWVDSKLVEAVLRPKYSGNYKVRNGAAVATIKMRAGAFVRLNGGLDIISQR